MTRDAATKSALASLTATMLGCEASEIMVPGSIGIPERPGMSYIMMGVSTESASERKWASTPAWVGLL